MMNCYKKTAISAISFIFKKNSGNLSIGADKLDLKAMKTTHSVREWARKNGLGSPDGQLVALLHDNFWSLA